MPRSTPPNAAVADATVERKSRASRKSRTPLTTRENLSALIGSARQILRKDKGLNGDVGRLPLLTWVMFLKFLDDLEIVHEQEAELDGQRYRPIIEAPYRWRDWAAREDGLTGDELLAFINALRMTCQPGLVAGSASKISGRCVPSTWRGRPTTFRRRCRRNRPVPRFSRHCLENLHFRKLSRRRLDNSRTSTVSGMVIWCSATSWHGSRPSQLRSQRTTAA